MPDVVLIVGGPVVGLLLVLLGVAIGRRSNVQRQLDKLLDRELGPRPLVPATRLLTDAEAEELRARWIARYGSGS